MIRRLSAVVFIAALLLALIGCQSRPSLPETTSDPYRGPTLTLDASKPEYDVVVQAPTPGWVVSLDRVAEQYRHHAVFISLRRPNPGFLYPQVVVEQRVATTVPTTGAIRVYARILDPDDRSSSRPYSTAARNDTLDAR
jgi:hypothetical protein